MSMKLDDGPGQLGGENVPPAFQISPEEQKVLSNCSKEATIYRGLPFGALTGGAAYYLTTIGKLIPSQRFGFWPKVALASFAGYMVGKISYQIKCIEKLEDMPDSKLGIAMRKRKGLPLLPSSEDSGSTWASTPTPNDYYEGSQNPNNYYRENQTPSDFYQGNKTPSNYYQGSFQTPQDFSDNQNYDAVPAEKEDDFTKSSLTYDERRLQNRVDYFSDQNRKLSRLAERSPPAHLQEQRPPPTTPRERRNIYGDIIE